jgi:hypothetical protein
MVHCSSTIFMSGWLGAERPGCEEFPRDLQPFQPKIRAATEHWLHIYQTAFKHLKSGPAKHAHRSILLPFEDGGGRLMGAHSLTEDDPRVVAMVAEAGKSFWLP